MKITLAQPAEGWAPIANAALQDHRISWRAKGLLAELLSHRTGWETTVDKLVAQARLSGDATEGFRAMRNAMSELAKAGYVKYTRTSGPGGKWHTEIEVCDVPVTDVTETDTSVTDTSAPDTSVTDTTGPDVSDPVTVSTRPTTKTNNKKNTTKIKDKTDSLSGTPNRRPETRTPEEQERELDQAKKPGGKTNRHPEHQAVGNTPPIEEGGDPDPFAAQRDYLAPVITKYPQHTDRDWVDRLIRTIETSHKVGSLGWWEKVAAKGHLALVVEELHYLVDTLTPAKPSRPWCGKCDQHTRKKLDEDGYGGGVVMRPCPRCSDKAEPRPTGHRSPSSTSTTAPPCSRSPTTKWPNCATP